MEKIKIRQSCKKIMVYLKQDKEQIEFFTRGHMDIVDTQQHVFIVNLTLKAMYRDLKVSDELLINDKMYHIVQYVQDFNDGWCEVIVK